MRQVTRVERLCKRLRAAQQDQVAVGVVATQREIRPVPRLRPRLPTHEQARSSPGEIRDVDARRIGSIATEDVETFPQPHAPPATTARRPRVARRSSAASPDARQLVVQHGNLQSVFGVLKGDAPGQEIVGIWAIDVRPDALPPGAPPLHTITVFDRAGSATGLIDRLLPPIPPILAVGSDIAPMHGLWRRRGAEFTFSLYTVIMDDGVVTGYHRVRNVVRVRGDELTGIAYAEFFDLNWNLLLPPGASAVSGRRVE
jgi:hypothetical protein